MASMSSEQIKEVVRREYGERAASKDECGCCRDRGVAVHLVANLGYTPDQLEAVPAAAQEKSFGCGNPLLFADVKTGDVVLDIGSGAGIDCLIAAQKVGAAGRVIGLDMTPAMIARATENALEAGVENVEFRLGDAEDMPVDDSSVDWVVSNCVINLAPDKERVFAEVQRVLKPGCKLAISDIVLGDELPQEVLQSVDALIGCLGGAVRESTYLQAMQRAGLEGVQVSARQVYDAAGIEGLLDCGCGDGARLSERYKDALAGKVWSARLQAEKP